MENQEDIRLVARYLKGDDKALEVLIKRYLKPIYNFAYRYTENCQEAEDITQEVFLKVWRNLKKFDQNKNFKNWIFCIARNTSIDWLKKKRPLLFSNFEKENGSNFLVDNLADPSSFVEKFLGYSRINSMLAAAMEKLSEEYRAVLLLHYNDHFAFREIAETLGEPLNTVKSRHRRALILLRKILLFNS